MVFRTWSLGAAVLVLNLGTAAAGDLPGDPSAGREIAESWCGECHDVEPGGMDVYAGVPAFQTLADTPAFTETALRAFLRSPHGDMPDVMPTRQQTDDIIAYILSLKGR
jgi:mono/diheme cytochrome c family protein